MKNRPLEETNTRSRGTYFKEREAGAEAYLEPSRTFTMDRFRENS